MNLYLGRILYTIEVNIEICHCFPTIISDYFMYVLLAAFKGILER